MAKGFLGTYPFSSIEVLPGDVLYSSIGRSTYYVGHAVIIGTDGMCKEALPGKQAGHELSIPQLWSRHLKGNQILLMRAKIGARDAAHWATQHLESIKQYNLSNYNFNNISQNYCFKFIAQAYFFGAQVSLMTYVNKPITPFAFKRTKVLDKIALFQID